MGSRSIAWAALAALLVLAPGAGPAAATADSIAGHLLVAEDGMPDPRFAETVIFMVRHDETGAFGIIVNRYVAARPLAELLEAMGQVVEGAEGVLRLHIGGPVEAEIGFVLHTSDYQDESIIAVGDRYALNSGVGVLREIATGAGPRRYLFAFGYAGWGPGQLEGELARGDWFVVPANEDVVFDDAYGTKWLRCLDARGIDL
jgi:putative transcriptional regulator